MCTLVPANQTREAAGETRVPAVASVTCCNRLESDVVGRGISRQSPNSLYGWASRVLGFAGREVGVESARVTREHRSSAVHWPSAVYWPSQGRPKRWAWPITCQMLQHATAEAGHLSGGAGASIGDQTWSRVGITASGIAGLAREPSKVQGQNSPLRGKTNDGAPWEAWPVVRRGLASRHSGSMRCGPASEYGRGARLERHHASALAWAGTRSECRSPRAKGRALHSWSCHKRGGMDRWDIPWCLTHPLETDKWDGQVGQWQVPLSLDKGMSHFPIG